MDVQLGVRVGKIPRPSLIGALILKAKARIDTAGGNRDRHCEDFAVLAAMLAATDLRALVLTTGERRSLRRMIELTRQSPKFMQVFPNVEVRMQRLEQFVG